MLSVSQGAGGEPMEISEQVGMTPDIVQKVRFPTCNKSIFGSDISIFLRFGRSRMCSNILISFFSSKTRLRSSLQRERRYYVVVVF